MRPVERPIKTISHIESSPFLAITTYCGPSFFLNQLEGERIDVSIPINGTDLQMPAHSLELHPDGNQILATFPPGHPHPIMAIDLQRNRMFPALTFQSGAAFMNAKYVGQGANCIVGALNGGSKRPAGGIVLIESAPELFDLSYIFERPSMDFQNQAPGIQVSPYAPIFAISTTEGSAQHETGMRTNRVALFEVPLVPDTELTKLEPLFSMMVRERQSSWQEPPYFPPITFTPQGRLLMGTKQGVLQLKNLRKPQFRDDYRLGETLTEFKQGHEDSPILCVATSQDEEFYASGSDNGRVAIWIPESGIGYKLPPFNAPIRKLNFIYGAKTSLLIETRPDQTEANQIPPTEFYEVQVSP